MTGQQRESGPAAVTPWFAFHSDLATNLNDALIVAGQARKAGEPELFAGAGGGACFSQLPPPPRSGWTLAVDWYAEIVSLGGWRAQRQLLIRLDTPEGGHILISSAMPDSLALEAAFHEASHTLMRSGDPIPRALGEAAAEQGVELPPDLWHVLLFYTTGEAVRQTLEDAGQPDYTPFLYSLERFGTGAWGRDRAALERTWPPYLGGKRSLPEALSDLLRIVGEADGKAEQHSAK